MIAFGLLLEEEDSFVFYVYSITAKTGIGRCALIARRDTGHACSGRCIQIGT